MILEAGRTVQLSVVEVLKADPGHVTTLPPGMEEQIVREMPWRSEPVILTLAQVKFKFFLLCTLPMKILMVKAPYLPICRLFVSENNCNKYDNSCSVIEFWQK